MQGNTVFVIAFSQYKSSQKNVYNETTSADARNSRFCGCVSHGPCRSFQRGQNNQTRVRAWRARQRKTSPNRCLQACYNSLLLFFLLHSRFLLRSRACPSTSNNFEERRLTETPPLSTPKMLQLGHIHNPALLDTNCIPLTPEYVARG